MAGDAAMLVRACLAAGGALLCAAAVCFGWTQRRRQAAIDLLREHSPARLRHLDREGGLHALRKWSDKHPDAEDDDRLREALLGMRRMLRVTGRFAVPGLVLCAIGMAIAGTSHR